MFYPFSLFRSKLMNILISTTPIFFSTMDFDDGYLGIPHSSSCHFTPTEVNSCQSVVLCHRFDLVCVV